MTTPFYVFWNCAECHSRTTAQSAFVRWMRNQKSLDSVEGIVRTDMDHIILRYKTSLDGRDFQLAMVVEEKQFGAKPDPAQRDILSIINQLCGTSGRNLRGVKTRTSKMVWSPMFRRKVRVRWLGCHLLQFSHSGPEDSDWIKWDHKVIDRHILAGLLAIERDPYCPEKFIIELLRDRHNKRRQPMLFGLDTQAA